MTLDLEAIIIARQLSISEGRGTVDEQHPASWIMTAAEIIAALNNAGIYFDRRFPAKDKIYVAKDSITSISKGK